MRLGKGIPTIPKEAYQRAAKGEISTGIHVVPGYTQKIAWGVAVLQAPINRFWAGINDGEAHAGKTPISFAKVISGKPCMDQRQMLMILPIPIMTDRWWIIQTSINTKLKKASQGNVREMSWVNIPNADQVSLPANLAEKIRGKHLVDFTKGAWLVYRLNDEYILGEYHTWASGNKKVPSSIMDSLVQSSIVKTMRVMETHASKKTLRCLDKMP